MPAPPVKSNLSTADSTTEDIAGPPVEQLMEDEDVMSAVVRLVNDDTENLETNLEMLRHKQDKKIFATYYNQLAGKTY